MKDPVLPKQSSEKRTELKMSLFDFRVYCKATVIKQHSIDTHTHTHTLRSVKQSLYAVIFLGLAMKVLKGKKSANVS